MASRHAEIERVVHVIPAPFGDDGIVGGAERYAYELARHMARVVDTTLVAFSDRSRTESDGPLRIRVIGDPIYVRGQRTNPFSLRILPEIARADVIHCHQRFVTITSASALIARALRRRVFVTDLGGGGWDISNYVSTAGLFHGHLHISSYSSRIYGQENDPRARVILGGVDADKFSPNHAGSGDLSADPDPAAVFVGRLLPHKSVNDLIDAAPDWMRVKIIGRVFDRAYADFLKRRAEGKRVVFSHEIDDESLVEAYRNSLCVVLPSVYRTIEGLETRVPELLGQTLLEGMACGVPAICTNVASMPEIVRHDVTGYIVPPNDPAALRTRLIQLQRDSSLRARMGKAARAHVLEHYQWSNVVDRCRDAYQSLS